MTKEKLIERVRMHCPEREIAVFHALDYFERQGFYTAPASSAHHNNYEGGLLDHSFGVAMTAMTIKKALDQDKKISDESCFITGLFHDIHKCCDGFGNPGYVPNILKSGKVSEGKPYESNKARIDLAGGYQSGILITQFIPLHDYEIQAICCHDGQYVPENRTTALKEHPLTLILHWADMWNGILVEQPESLLYKESTKRFLVDDTSFPTV